MQFSDDSIELMEALNCEVRFVSRAPTYIDNPVPGGVPIVDKTKPAGISCEVIDKSVRSAGPYVKDIWMPDKASAFKAALEAAQTAEKPLTPAQQYQAQKMGAVRVAKDAEIAALRKQLEEAGVTPIAPVPAADVPPPVEQAPQAPASKSIKQKALNTNAKTF